MRRIRWVFGFGLASSAVACSLFSSFSDLQPDSFIGAAAPDAAANSEDAQTVQLDASALADAAADAAIDASGVGDAGAGTFCTLAAHKICADFEGAGLASFASAFPNTDSVGASDLTVVSAVASSGAGSLLAQINSQNINYAAARRSTSISGNKALTIEFDIYPESLPTAPQRVGIAFVQAVGAGMHYMTYPLFADTTSLTFFTNRDNTSTGTPSSSQALGVGVWTHVKWVLAMDPTTGTSIRLELTPPGAASPNVAINQVLAAATLDQAESMTIAAGIYKYDISAASPPLKIYFDNYTVDYP